MHGCLPYSYKQEKSVPLQCDVIDATAVRLAQRNTHQNVCTSCFAQVFRKKVEEL